MNEEHKPEARFLDKPEDAEQSAAELETLEYRYSRQRRLSVCLRAA